MELRLYLCVNVSNRSRSRLDAGGGGGGGGGGGLRCHTVNISRVSNISRGGAYRGGGGSAPRATYMLKCAKRREIRTPFLLTQGCRV